MGPPQLEGNEVQGMDHAFRLWVMTSRRELHGRLSYWYAFASDEDVHGGLFCDPAAVERMIRFDEAQRLVIVEWTYRGRIDCFMPFVLSVRPLGLRIGSRRLASVAARVLRLYDFEFPVRASKDRLALLTRALPHIRRRVPCDLIIVQNCVVPDCTGALANGRAARPTLLLRKVQRTFLLRFTGSFEDYLAQMRAKTRQTWKRKVRRLQKGYGSCLETKVFRKVAEMPVLKRHLNAVWRNSWHGSIGSGGPPGTSFLEGMASRGWVRSYVCFVDGTAIAYVEGYQYKGKYLYESLAYDHRWAKYSPGAVLDYFLLEDLFERNRPRVLDFGYGYNQYKESLGTSPQDRGELWVPCSSKGRGILKAMSLLDAIHGAGKASLGKTAFWRRIRAAGAS